MSPGEIQGAQQQVPLASVWRAYRGVFGRPLALAKIAAIPSVLVATTVFSYFLLPWRDQPGLLLFFPTLLLPLSYIGFAWMRFSLLGTTAAFIPQAPWVGSYLMFLGLAILWAVWMFGVPFAIVIFGARLLVLLAENPWDYYEHISAGTIPTVLWLNLMVLCVFCLGRPALMLPACVLRFNAPLRSAWQWSSRQTRRLGGALVLVLLSFLIGEVVCFFGATLIYTASISIFGIGPGPFVDETAPVMVGAAVLLIGSLAGSALFAEFLAIVFRELTGWQGAQRELLARFD